MAGIAVAVANASKATNVITETIPSVKVIRARLSKPSGKAVSVMIPESSGIFARLAATTQARVNFLAVRADGESRWIAIRDPSFTA
ncbi:unannotated protein [freshwater metagenome]|uniref:Unannotated protein n=1 Tax=freshwater metagenome TaxID=449393 RepID=A0A6J7Q6E4_9ZZZZ